MTATKDTPVGAPLPENRVHAANLGQRSDRDFEMNIHDDKTASKLGFKRGFVPGGQTMSWITRVVVDFFGESAFRTGKLQCTYVAPVFDDDDVLVTGAVRERITEGDGVRLVCDIWMDKADGQRAIAGTVSAVVH